MSDDFFAELEAEMAVHIAKSKLKTDAATLKREANNMRLDANIRKRKLEEWRAVHAIIDANAWEPIRAGALFSEQVCDGCGSIHRTFLQFMQLEEKITNRSSRRWTRVALPMEGLPRETIVQPLKTHFCADCADDHGFDAKNPSIRLMPLVGGLTVSSNYVQGDINGTSSES